jgi:hypothetical protein
MLMDNQKDHKFIADFCKYVTEFTEFGKLTKSIDLNLAVSAVITQGYSSVRISLKDENGKEFHNLRIIK